MSEGGVGKAVPLTMLFGRVVAGLRREARLSQAVLASRLRWERTLLGRVETGRNTANVDHIFALDGFFVAAGLLDRHGDLWALFTGATQIVCRRGLVVLSDGDRLPEGVEIADQQDVDRITRRLVEDWVDDRVAQNGSDNDLRRWS